MSEMRCELDMYGVRFLCDVCREGEMVGEPHGPKRKEARMVKHLNRCMHCQAEAWLDAVYPAYRFQIKPARYT